MGPNTYSVSVFGSIGIVFVEWIFSGCGEAGQEKAVHWEACTFKKSTLNPNNNGLEKMVFPMSSLGMLGYSMGEHLMDVNKKQPH